MNKLFNKALTATGSHVVVVKYSKVMTLGEFLIQIVGLQKHVSKKFKIVQKSKFN